MQPLVLASGSPRRKQLLKDLGLKFQVIISDFREIEHTDYKPEQHVQANALGKAQAVAGRYKDALVIGADTVVVFNRKAVEKPRNMAEAGVFLERLQGRTHAVYTGLAVINRKKRITLTDYVKTMVTMRRLNRSEMAVYLAMINPLDKAGAYAIQGPGSIIVEKISGCYYNVVGFPIAKLEDMLLTTGLTLFDYMER